MAARRSATVHVIVETGMRRVFASALEWPGWSRSGRDEAGALETLAAYADRYRLVTDAAGARFPAHPAFEVVERVQGNATTDFGASGIAAQWEHDAPTVAEAKRLAALLRAAWDAFDAIATAAPESLRKGPRGGGRDRSKVVEHTVGAEQSYSRQLGVRLPAAAPGDPEAVEATRAAILEAVHAAARGGAPATKWPARYAVRRIMWHVLDHAWEIEDRSEG